MSGPAVSDHALLRFLERAGQLDVEQLRASLEEALARAGEAASGICADDYMIKSAGLVFLVRQDTVVTVMPEGTRSARHRSLKRPPRTPR